MSVYNKRSYNQLQQGRGGMSSAMRKSNWISVKDSMPNRGETVLTVRIRRHTGKPYIAMDLLSVDNQWIYAMQDSTLYWQPLPEMPKEFCNSEN